MYETAVQSVSAKHRQTGGGRTFGFSKIIGDAWLLQVLRETASPILKITPVNEISPKHDTLNTRESFYLEPFARNGIGESRKNSKLLDVERLIQMAFFQNVCQLDTAKLFVVCHCRTRQRPILEKHKWGEHPIADALLPRLLLSLRSAPTNEFLKMP